MDVTKRIEELMNSKGWTKYRLAKNSGLPQSTITSLLSGRVNKPSTDSLTKIANAFGVSVGFLLGEEEEVLTNIYYNEAKAQESIIRILKRISDDDGFFPTEFHRDLFEIFGGYAAGIEVHRSSFVDTRGFDKWYQYDYLNKTEEELTESDEEFATDEFNKFYNYRTVRDGIQTLHRFIIINKTVEDFLSELVELCRKHKIAIEDVIKESSASYSAEKELFDRSLDLSDEEIKQRFDFKVDGHELTEEEYQRMIAAVRAERLYRDSQK